MKPIIFYSAAQMHDLANRFLQAGVYDDWSVQNMQSFFLTGMFYEIDTIPGFVALHGVVPGRDATLYIVTYDGDAPRSQYTGRRLPPGIYNAFLSELRLFGEMLFREFGLQRLTAVCRTDNRPSSLLLRKLGFKQEGIIRHASRVHGRLGDLYTFGILREEVIHGLQPVAQQDHARVARVGERTKPVATPEPTSDEEPGLDVRRPDDSPVDAGRSGWWSRFLRRLSA